MIYSSRLKKIVQYCLKHRDRCVTLDELAEVLKTSKRTIFRELKNVDQDLAEYDLTLHHLGGKGITIEGEETRKEELQKELAIDGVDYINKEERQQLLMFELLRTSSINKLLHYANLFQVSQATISNDLDVIEPWLQAQHLQLIRTPGIGVEVQGLENDMRIAMSKLLHENLQIKEYTSDVNYLDAQTLLHQIFIDEDKSSIMHLLNQDILERILNVFHTYLPELSLDRYAQSSYIGLIIHLVIAIERIMKKEEIKDNNKVIEMIKEDTSFVQAEKMAQYLEIEFDIDIPKTEIAFIALHIKGAKITSAKEESDEQGTKMDTLIENMIASYDDSQRGYLLQDVELFQGLRAHLKPTIIRLQNDLPIYNPLLSQIKEEYPTLFQQSKQACIWLEKECGHKVSEDEIGFLTMHIGASLERNKQHAPIKQRISIGVVCASGIGVSAMLCARIAKAFPIKVHLETFAMEEILQGNYQDCELLVSTFPLELVDIPCVQVSPLLNCEDITKLQKVMNSLQENPLNQTKTKKRFSLLLTEILQQITSYKSLLENIYFKEIDSSITSEELLSFIAQQYSTNKEEESALYEALIKREEKGSICLPKEGFALFHARSEGITQGIVQFYYPQKECFESASFNGLTFLIVLLDSNDLNTSHAKLLSVISRGLLEEESFLQAIKKRNLDQVLKEIEELLKKQFIQYLEDVL